MAAKKFIRTQVPRVERAISIGLLLFLVTIGVAVAVKGQQYDPYRYALNPEFLEKTREAPALTGGAAIRSGGAGIVRSSGGSEAGMESAGSYENYDEGSGAEGAQAGAAIETIDLGTLQIDGLNPIGPVEAYSADTLFEKINGRAEGYMTFNFKALRVKGFDLGGGSFVDIQAYDMGDPINAYGIFSMERNASAVPVDFAGDGYIDGSSYFLRQGKFYLQILASDEKPATAQAAEKIARAVAAAAPADDEGLAGRKSLPVEGMNAKTLAYVPSDAFGIPGLTNVFQAEYETGGKTMKFFVSSQPDEAAARKVFDDFKGFSAQFGTVADGPAIEGGQSFATESFGQHKIVYQRGAEVGGVVDADDAAAARSFVEKHLAAAGN